MQGKKLFVGNLSHCVGLTEETEQLKGLFSSYGDVVHVNVIKERRSGFVEMSSPLKAERAKHELNDCEFKECRIPSGPVEEKELRTDIRL